MSHAILISNNEVVNNLYEVNLRAYVGVSVTIKKNLAGAIALMEQVPHVDAIICFKELNEKESAIEKLMGFLDEKSLRVPVIVLGEPAGKLPKTISLRNRYDIKGLLQSMAKILQITAKDMAEKSVPKYFPIPIKLFASIEQSICDIYYRTEAGDFEYEYFKIIETGKEVGNSLQKYLDEGVETLYIDANYRLSFINKTSGVILKELTRTDISAEERVELTSQGMSIVAEEIFESDEVTEEIAQISQACIESIQSVIQEAPSVKNLLKMLLENKGDFAYKHSVLATYLACGIIKNISWGSQEQQNKVSFALFFHDIYLVPLFKKYPDCANEEDFLFRSDVSEEEKTIVLEHAMLAGRLVKTFPRCPMGADMIITQHHGMTNGQGFAVNYKDDISPLSKIIIIAEDIATDILARLKAGDAKKIADNDSYLERLRERYKNHTYKKIIEAFREVAL
ncbi:MAG: hypothetical protein CME64_01805 [Halobacteriovoraceae bacterium]|nr:hypothetical protein [Halobacteriovoraceae bacterium]|tara:strand:+ start:60233 stop:61591 length:1359 start_codon:yes stop_codon:yes gene_type:complete